MKTIRNIRNKCIFLVLLFRYTSMNMKTSKAVGWTCSQSAVTCVRRVLTESAPSRWSVARKSPDLPSNYVLQHCIYFLQPIRILSIYLSIYVAGWVMSSRTWLVRCSYWRRESIPAGTPGQTATGVTASCRSGPSAWWVGWMDFSVDCVDCKLQILITVICLVIHLLLAQGKGLFHTFSRLQLYDYYTLIWLTVLLTKAV